MGVPWWVWPQSVLWVLVHAYLWLRLVRDTTVPGGWPRRIGTVLLVTLSPAVPGALIAMHTMSPSAGSWITWPGFIWYGLLVYLLTVLVIGELVRLGVTGYRRIRRRRRAATDPDTGEHPIDTGRRRFLAQTVAVSVGALATGIVGYGMAAAFSTPRVKRVTIQLRRLPPAAVGYRIALVGDIHIGPFIGRDDVRRVVQMVNNTGPDLVVIPGDLVDGSVPDLRSAVEPLRALNSRHGTVFTTGNHEYLFDVDAWVRHLRTMGIRTLRNERLSLPGFDLAGVNDLSGDYVGDPPDYARALGGRDDRPVVLVAHHPAQVSDAATFDVDLQLSGHTHGGQFFPNNVLSSLGEPTLSGLTTVGRTQLYVTSGTGFWGPPIRVGSMPDISVLELVRQE